MPTSAWFYRGLICCLGAALSVICRPAFAQAYPSHPVRIVVAFSTGTASDIMARLFAQKLGESLGQQFIVENRDGAGGTVGSAIVAKAAPDGYTVLLAGGSFAIAKHLYPKLPYDPFKDLPPVAMFAVVPNVLIVNPALPARSVKELIAIARAHPGKLDYASSGKGSPSFLYMELLKSMTRIDIVEIPYKSSAQALADVIGGQIAMNMPAPPARLPPCKGGRLRALAMSGARRAPALPEVPSMNESAGITGYDAIARYGFIAPAGTPADIVRRLQNEILKIIAQPEM